MSGFATWDKISGAVGSTTTTFGGSWANLISDYLNGVDLVISDPTKLPKINTLTRFKSGKFGLFDTDESHEVIIYPEDIDDGPQREIIIRRMIDPFEIDHMVLEGNPAVLLNKDIDGDDNDVHDLDNTAIKTGANIDWDKISKTGSLLDDIADVVFSGVASQDIVYRNATSQWANLPKGANNTYLGIDGSGNLAYSTVPVGIHATSHKSGGSDAIKLDELAAPTDVTTLNATTSAHGLLKKLSNVNTEYMDGTGNWSTPAGGGGGITASSTDTLSNKNISFSTNTVTDASIATGDLAKSNGTKYVRWAKGGALTVPRVNSGGTDLEWSTLDSERTGKAIANGNGSTTIFNIAHGLGATPAYAFVDCSSHALARQWTVDGTNITVTFATAPSSGTNNVIIYWRVIAA